MATIAARIHDFFAATGYSLNLLVRAARYTPRIHFRWRAIVREMWIIGVETLPLSCVFLLLIGMVFAHNIGAGLVPLGQEDIVGGPVAFGMARELGPLMTAFVLVARIGSSMAAEVSTMSVSEEITALRIMAISPEDYIAMPRIFAFALMGPMLTVIATCVGIMGGMIVAWLQFNVPYYVYINTTLEWIEPPLALYWSVMKAIVFAIIGATVACSFGLRARGGALGVGKASRDTVVYSLLLIVFFNFVMTSMYQFVVNIIEGQA